MANEPKVQAFQIVYPQPNAPYPNPSVQAFGIVIPPPDYPKLKAIHIKITQPPDLTDQPKLKAIYIAMAPVQTVILGGTYKQMIINS